MKKITIIILSVIMLFTVGCRKKEDIKPVATNNDKQTLAGYKPNEPEPTPVKETAPVKTTTQTTITTTEPTPTEPTPTEPTPTQPTPTQPSTVTIYKFTCIDPDTTIKNNPKFKVSLSTLSPKIGDTVILKVETDSLANIMPSHGEVYGNGNMFKGSNARTSEDKKTYTAPIVIQDQQTFPDNTIQVYVFVTNHDDKTISEYKFTLDVQK